MTLQDPSCFVHFLSFYLNSLSLMIHLSSVTNPRQSPEIPDPIRVLFFDRRFPSSGSLARRPDQATSGQEPDLNPLPLAT